MVLENYDIPLNKENKKNAILIKTYRSAQITY